jgi:phenylacetate-CoA ligase
LGERPAAAGGERLRFMSLEDRLYPLLRLYEAAPTWVRRSVGMTYRGLPARLRLGKAYASFLALSRRFENASPDEIAAWQFEQVRDMVRHAAATCPWYTRSFRDAGFEPASMRSLEDLVRLPLLDKRTLQEHLPDLVSTAYPESARMYITTGGSTGVPVGFYLHKGVSRPKEQAYLETQWMRGGYFAGARLAVIRGQVTSPRAAGRIAYHDATRDWLMLSSYHLTAERVPDYIEALERFRPNLIHAYPSAALLLARHLEASGRRWTLPLRGLLCGSEQMSLQQKRMVERVFGCRVYRWYGHAERVVLAGEGRTTDLFYFFPTYGYVEFGAPDEQGLCEVIGTSFHNRVMPLIRYRTGDYVKLADPASPREFPWPAAESFLGREQEFLVSATGRRISLTAFNMHDGIFDGLYAVQFFQDSPGRAEFRYSPGPSFQAQQIPRMAARIREKLGDDFVVELRQVAEVEKTARGKHRWLVSRLPEGQGAA